MKKSLSVLLALTLALGMTACAGKDGSSSFKVADITTAAPADTSGIDNSSVGTEQFGEDGDIGGGLGATYNLFIENTNGALDPAASISLSHPFNINEGIDIVLKYTPYFLDKDSVGADLIETGILNKNGIEANICFVCNGQVIKHSLDPNEEASEKTTITATVDEDLYTHIYIPPTQLGNVENALLWVCIYPLPEYVPESPRGEAVIPHLWPVAVTSSGAKITSSAYEAQEKDYIYGEYPGGSLNSDAKDKDDFKDHDLDIGKYNERSHSSAKITMDDVAVIDKDADFAVTAYFEEECDYYLAVFCDGELINAFDGKPLMKANCQGGKRMIKYSLDKEQLPDNGDHAYSVIAMPQISLAGLDGNWCQQVSYRRLVRISK